MITNGRLKLRRQNQNNGRKTAPEIFSTIGDIDGRATSIYTGTSIFSMIKSLELITVWIIYPAIFACFFTIAIFTAFYITLGIKLAFDKLFAIVCERWHLGNNGAAPPQSSPSLTANVQGKEVEEAVKVLEIIPAPATYKRSRNHSIVSCAICLEDLKDGELCQTLPDCQHAFHSSCIKPWLIKMPNCPICRQSLSIV